MQPRYLGLTTTLALFGVSCLAWWFEVTTPPQLLVDLVLIVGVSLSIAAVVYLVFGVMSKGTASNIKMTVGESGPFLNAEGGLYDIRRTLNLRLENIDSSKPISDCTVTILSAPPYTDSEGPWLLENGVSLAAGEHVFIPLVTYGEAADPDKYPCADSFMTMGTADQYPLLSIGEKYTVTIRATAPETAFCDFRCKIWIDDNGQLRIEGI